MGEEKQKKQDDIISNETYLLLKEIGFDCKRNIYVSQLVILLENKYPNSILTTVPGTHLPVFREDIFDEATKLYKNDFWGSRDYMVRLAIKEIIEKEEFINGLSKQDRKDVYTKVFGKCKHDKGVITCTDGPSICAICREPIM